jgi:hypothetical protein
MLLRVVITAVLIAAVMVGVKDGRLMRDAGLAGKCRVVETAKDGTQWAACTGGRLAGRPSLASKSCTSSGLSGKLEYWHCPAEVVSRVGS